MELYPNTIGIVVLNYNNAEDTINLVQSLCDQENSSSLEIVVVDNKSTVGSFESLKSLEKLNLRVNVLQTGANLGYAKGNNVGLRFLEKFRPKYVAVLNNDVIINDKLLFDRLSKVHQDIDDAGFIAPIQIDANGSIRQNCARRIPTFRKEVLSSFLPYVYIFKSILSYNLQRSEGFREVDILSGAFIFGEFDFFKSIGYFDPGTFLFLEERILCCKVREAGLKQFILPEIYYEHRVSVSINKKYSSIEQIKIYNESLLYYIRNYERYGRLKATLIIPVLRFKLFQFRILKILKFVLRGTHSK